MANTVEHRPGPGDPSRRPFAIGTVTVDGEEHAVRTDEILSLPGAVLTVFTRREPVRRQVLVVAPMSGGFAVLMRDLVLALLREADRVAVTDWRDERFVPAGTDHPFGFDDNVLHVARMMAALGPDLHVLGVCQGSIPAFAATSLAAEEGDGAPLSLSLLAAPIDPAVNPTRTMALACAHTLDWFDANVVAAVPPGFPGEGRRVYPRAVQAQLFWSYLARHMMAADEIAWKVWADDGEDPVGFPWLGTASTLLDIPARFFLENIGRVYQERALAAGSLSVDGRRVDPGAIARTRLLTIEGEHDDISAAGQGAAAHALCRSLPPARKAHALLERAGHFSLFHGRTLRERVAPLLREHFAAAESGPGPARQPVASLVAQ